MAITPINTHTVQGTKAADTTTDVLGKEDFLKLLVAQLQHQDPLNPLEGTEFTAQLAQFSSLEQLYNVNNNLGLLQNNQLDMNNTQAVSMIGKTAWAYGNIFQKLETSSTDLHFGLGGDATEVYINIYTEQGNFIKTISAGELKAAEHSISWDGTDSDGNRMPDGFYQFEVIAGNADGEMVGSETFITGVVSGVTFENGSAQLLINDLNVPMNQIVHVAGTEYIENTDESILTFVQKYWR